MMIEFTQLMEAYLECRRNKRNSMAALAFEIDLENNLVELYEDIINGNYKISPSIAFVVERPVRREVFAADFRDRIVHHLLMQLLMPHLEREFIYDSYACRVGKGTLFGIRRIRKFIAQCSQGYTKDCYILKCDISGFFMNIDRLSLWQRLEKFISTRDFGDSIIEQPAICELFSQPESKSELSELVLRLTKQIVMHNPIEGCRINGSRSRWNGLPSDKSLYGTNNLTMPNGFRTHSEGKNTDKGLPIGNLTSQWFGNFYLNSLDHFVKHTLGVRYYGRYVDDFVIVHTDKSYLKSLILTIEKFLKDELQLSLHPRKRYLQHYSKGVQFLGTYIKYGAINTGKRTKGGAYNVIDKWRKLSECRVLTPPEVEKFRDSLNSYLGIMRHHNSYRLRKKMASMFTAQIYCRVDYPGYCKIKIKREARRLSKRARSRMVLKTIKLLIK